MATPKTTDGYKLFRNESGNYLDTEGTYHGDDVGSMLMHELGWCGCGSPEDAVDMFRRYLWAVRWQREEYARQCAMDGQKQGGWSAAAGGYQYYNAWSKAHHGLTDNEFLLVAYAADAAKLTEHGGSVYGAWLTQKGDVFAEALDREWRGEEVEAQLVDEFASDGN